MKINFFYCPIDYALCDFYWYIYIYLQKNQHLYKENGFIVNLINVNIVSNEYIAKISNNVDVNVIDGSMVAINFFNFNIAPYNMIMKKLKDKQHYIDAYETIINANTCKIFFINAIDLHSNWINLESFSKIDGLFWVYEKRPIAFNEVPPQYKECWINEQTDSAKIHDEINLRIKCRAEVPHSISTFTGKIKKKFFDYSVPGCTYNTRIIAQKSFEHTNLRKAPYNTVEYVIANLLPYVAKTGISKSFINRHYINVRKFNYKFNIEHSSVSFVCGSGICVAVRKFFEIPSYRSLLLAYPCTGFHDYGFIDGVNCIETSPEDAGKTALKILKNTTLYEKIVKNGFEHILREHSLPNRLSQMFECIKRISKGQSINAQYINGKFEISEN